MDLPWWVNFVIASVLLIVASELGYLVGRRLRARGEDEVGEHGTGIIAAAMLGLLALLLGFSFSIVATRYDTRKGLVLEEANAIGTAYLRAEMVAAPHGDRIQELLRAYVALRVESRSPRALQQALERSEQLHHELWVQALGVEAHEPQAHATSLLVQALNKVIDLHEARVTVAIYQRLPAPMRIVLYVVAVLAMGVVGGALGRARGRARLATFSLVLAIATVIVLIFELDRPLSSLVGVNQRAMRDVAETMSHRDQPARVEPGGR